MDSFEDKLNRHIDKVLEIQRNKEEKPLTLLELKEVDLSLGMTEEEWDALMKRADDNAIQAQSHYNYGNYSEAINVAEQAVSINPYHEQAILVHVKAAIGLYEADDEEQYLEKAKNSAKELLKINPNENQAIELLAKIDKLQKAESSERKKIGKYVGIGVVAILIILGLIYLIPKNASDNSADNKEDTQLRYQLIELEENANARWAQVENVISRRDQMLPQIMELAANTSEKELKSEIESLSNQIEQSEDLYKKITLQAQMQDKIKELLTVLSSSNSDQKQQMILVQIEGSYNRVSVEGKRYNEAVKEYNIFVKKYSDKFPGFKEKAYFKGN